VSPLNLATEPFRNERLYSVLLAAAAVVVLALTVEHAILLRRVLPGTTSALHRQVDRLERQAGTARDEARNTPAARPDATTLAQWSFLKDLVDKRAFSWTQLFAVLEETLPANVRLVSVAPRPAKGAISLEMTAQARSYQDGLEFLRLLQERPEFSDVSPKVRGDEQGQMVEYQYRMVYRPEAAVRPRPVAVQATEAPPPSSPAHAANPEDDD